MTSQNIYSLHTPAKGILSDPPSPLAHQIQAPPPSSYCWRYGRWPCHSRPCVPSGILSCPQPAAPRSVKLLTIYLRSRSNTALRRSASHLCGALKNTQGRFTQAVDQWWEVGICTAQHSCNACQIVLSAAMSSYWEFLWEPIYAPPPPLSWRQQLMLRIVCKV